MKSALGGGEGCPGGPDHAGRRFAQKAPGDVSASKEENEWRAAYDLATDGARADFERQEDDRLRTLGELVAGDQSRMHETLDSVMPLELPVPCVVS